MKCTECGIPLVSEKAWRQLDPAAREKHSSARTLTVRAPRSLCRRDYVRAQRALGPRPAPQRRTNEETHDLFRKHDPGPELTNLARFEAASKATGIPVATFRTAAHVGQWDMDAPEPIDLPSFTHRGVTYWIKPGETRADAIRRVRHRLHISPLQRKTA